MQLTIGMGCLNWSLYPSSGRSLAVWMVYGGDRGFRQGSVEVVPWLERPNLAGRL